MTYERYSDAGRERKRPRPPKGFEQFPAGRFAGESHSPERPASFIPADDARQANPTRLRFTKNELPPVDAQHGKKLDALQTKEQKADARLDAAREQLPHKRRPKVERVYDETKGKAKHKLHFEKEVLPPGAKKPAAPVAAVKGTAAVIGRAGIRKLHEKIGEVEHENVGVKAAHRTEQATEGVYRGGRKIAGSAVRHAKQAPYRRVAKLEHQSTRAHVTYAWQKSLHDNPQLNSNLLSQYLQKQKIKRQYAKAAREARRAASAAKKTATTTEKLTVRTVAFVKRHPVAFGIIGALLGLVFFLSTALTSCSNMATGGISSIILSSYLAEDADINSAELIYTDWETTLQEQIQNAERSHPGYDEYRYRVDDIGHNPFELMAFLTAVYQDFQYSAVQPVLRQIFEQQYSLVFREEIEVRYRTETRTSTHTDPVTGEITEESYEVEVPYNWYILHVELASRSFYDVILPRMDAEQREMFSLYMETKGNRQYLKSPFGFNWLPYVSCYYGYRIHPISGQRDYHKAVDIAVPTGTEILAGQDGTITTAAYDSGYGWYVVIYDGEGLVSKYAHCSALLVSAGQQVKAGDVIAKVGSTGNSTGPHLHLEVLKDGQYLNPIYFAETLDDGSGPSYGNPGAPMGDGSYAALIAEAEKYLGYPYVWGGSTPETSFDCSGFVCWVLNHSGVASVGRTTAQGLYNRCTPVSPGDAQPGDLIFFTRTYSTTSAVTHVGIYVGGGQMLHCGKPIQYTSINTTYWRDHFYAFGRIS